MRQLSTPRHNLRRLQSRRRGCDVRATLPVLPETRPPKLRDTVTPPQRAVDAAPPSSLGPSRLSRTAVKLLLVPTLVVAPVLAEELVPTVKPVRGPLAFINQLSPRTRGLIVLNLLCAICGRRVWCLHVVPTPFSHFRVQSGGSHQGGARVAQPGAVQPWTLHFTRRVELSFSHFCRF